MKNYTRILTILFLALLTIVMSATAQTNDNKNKAIVETTDGTQQLNTDEISIIRFDGDKVTFVQPWGESVFDRTLRSLTFLRPLPGTLRLTVQAGINENKSNRAQAIDAGKLKSTWESGDQVYVYADAVSTTSIGTLTPASEDYGKSSATLQGNITGTGLGDGSTTLYFSTQPRATYSLTTQDGTVENLFYCTASASATITGGNATISGNLSFSRPFAVVKFSLKDKGNGDAAISATSLTVNDGTGTYVVTPASATDVIYVGIPAISSKTITLNTTDGSKYYYYQKTSVTFAESKYYAINVKMKESELARPLTFEAEAGVFTVTLTSDLAPLPSLEYSIDGGAWTTYICNAATPEGHTISFRGNNSGFFYYDGMNPPQTSTFSCSADCYLYGNMMSLLSANSYATATSVGESAFNMLFRSNTHIQSHATKELILPATTLASGCYQSLFNGCTALTRAPELPATTLASMCYVNMFSGCTALTTAPELPAKTLASMCYAQMFNGCSSLNSVTCLATDISADYCTDSWLYDVAATGTFTAHDANVGWLEGTNGIPSGWTHVNQYNAVNLASLTENYVAQDNDVLTGTLAGNYKITIANGATVTLRNATINGENNDNYNWAGITCLGNATIILEGTNTVKGFYNEYPGIQAAHNYGEGDEYTLTIQGTGSLTASSNGKAAGIGAAKTDDCGNISISGGSITATGGDQAAGIGGSNYGECGNISISGGTITAIGGDDAAGIGSGEGRTCGNITIDGGIITATGKSGGAGIGTGGTGASCGNISISGGYITATGGSKGAGIGTGKGLSCGDITITSGVTSVTATKGSDATNSIGVGNQGTCGTVTIGGVVGVITESPFSYPAPYGARPGRFSVSSTKQVFFSQGNLQATYDGSAWSWAFAAHQYDYIGNAAGNTNITNTSPYISAAGTVDLFCWVGASSGLTGVAQYGITSSSTTNDFGSSNSEALKSDWGNTIGSGWRTLTKDEWDYLLNTRTGATVPLMNNPESYMNGRYRTALINSDGSPVQGFILFPDGGVFSEGEATRWSYWENYQIVCTTAQWEALAAKGCVFLPSAWYRPNQSNTPYVWGGCLTYYWTSTPADLGHTWQAYCVVVLGREATLDDTEVSGYRNYGMSVRLVYDAN